MDNRIRDAFGIIHAPERLQRTTKAALRRRTFDYGRNVYRIRLRRRRLIACFLTIAVVISSLTLWFRPASSIGIDINPSIELNVNALDRVISLKGKNNEGLQIVQDLRFSGMLYDEALQKLLLSKKLKPYLDQGRTISITVTDGSIDHGEEMLSKVLCRDYHIADKNNILYWRVDWETMKAAEAAELCIPRYLALQTLRKDNPSITKEDIREIPWDEILVLAQTDIIEDPCHELNS